MLPQVEMNYVDISLGGEQSRAPGLPLTPPHLCVCLGEDG